MLEWFKHKEKLETREEFLEDERGALDDIAEELITEKNPEQRRKRAGRLAIALLSSFVAINSVVQPEEATAQEAQSTSVSQEAVSPDHRQKIIQESGLKNIMSDAQGKLGVLLSVFNGDPFFYNWHVYTDFDKSFGRLMGYLDGSIPITNEKEVKEGIEIWNSVPESSLREYAGHDIEVRGFEKVEFVSNEYSIVPGRLLKNDDVKKFIKERLHPNWLKSVDVIVFIPEQRYLKTTEDANAQINASTLIIRGRLTAGRLLPKGDSVSFFQRAGMSFERKNDFYNYMDALLFHEVVGHSGDWESSRILSAKERLDFLYEVTNRYQQPDRFINSRVTGQEKWWAKYFKKKKIDVLVSYHVVREYWGEMVQEYFKNSKAFQKKYPADFALVDKWIHFIEDKGKTEVVAER